MNKAQASKIHRRLLAVGKALSKVDEALSELSKEDREMFSDPMAYLYVGLRAKALRVIYSHYPELWPVPPDFDEISSDLQWEEVTLALSITKADLDATILSKLKPRSLKMAKVIGDVFKVYEERGLSINGNIIGARIRLLAETDRIEGFGDLGKWRYSEVALKG
jgi:hypothetical protein